MSEQQKKSPAAPLSTEMKAWVEAQKAGLNANH